MERWLRATEALVDDDEEIALARRIRDGYATLAGGVQRSVQGPAQCTARGRTVERLNSDLSVRGMLAPAEELLALEENLNQQERRQ